MKWWWNCFSKCLARMNGYWDPEFKSSVEEIMDYQWYGDSLCLLSWWACTLNLDRGWIQGEGIGGQFLPCPPSPLAMSFPFNTIVMLGWCKPSRWRAFAHRMDRLSKGMPPLLPLIQSTWHCTSSYSYRHSLSTIYCHYKDQEMRIGLVRLRIVCHACFIPSMLGAMA